MKKLLEGVFISVEGCDGAGKSTMLKVLWQRLLHYGYEVVLTREPGGSPLGEKIRDLILHNPMDPVVELLLFNASRKDHIVNTIRPNKAMGKIVISDRFSDSSHAYQGHGRKMVAEAVALEGLVVQQDRPDYTLYFDITIEESIKRLAARQGLTGQVLDRLDSETLEFKKRVLAGFSERRERYTVFDAMPDQSEVAQKVIEWVDTVFVPKHPLIKE